MATKLPKIHRMAEQALYADLAALAFDINSFLMFH